jgi:5-methylcytosine-specific restriction endonuclease McrA
VTTTRKGLRLLVAGRDGMTCRYCGHPLIEWDEARKSMPRNEDGTIRWDWPDDGRPRLATLDHVDASIRRKGRNALANLALACSPCNASKGDRPAPAAAVHQ